MSGKPVATGSIESGSRTGYTQTLKRGQEQLAQWQRQSKAKAAAVAAIWLQACGTQQATTLSRKQGKVHKSGVEYKLKPMHSGRW